jgi:hypothetical protein
MKAPGLKTKKLYPKQSCHIDLTYNIHVVMSQYLYMQNLKVVQYKQDMIII